MVSFAEVNQDDALSANSTILNLFATSSAAVSLEVTRWDKTLLRVRYTRQHGSRMQMWQMETRAINAAIGIVALGLCRWVFPCSEAAGRDRQWVNGGRTLEIAGYRPPSGDKRPSRDSGRLEMPDKQQPVVCTFREG